VGGRPAPAAGSTIGDGPRRRDQAYYSANGAAILLQASLVHGLAGIALIVLAVAVPRVAGDAGRTRPLASGAGILAGALSLVQVGLAIVATLVAQAAPASTSARYLDAINLTDTAKITALAVFIAAATLRAFQSKLLAVWVVVLAAVTVPALLVGGLAFLVSSAVLDAVLAASLVLLLAWAIATAATIAWRTR
jgi:hypothetical protein